MPPFGICPAFGNTGPFLKATGRHLASRSSPARHIKFTRAEALRAVAAYLQYSQMGTCRWAKVHVANCQTSGVIRMALPKGRAAALMRVHHLQGGFCSIASHQ